MRYFPRAPMILTALAALALAGAAAGPAAGATAATAATAATTATGATSIAAVTPAACSAWNGGQPVNPDTSARLQDVAAVSACDVWAVGGSDSRGLIEHWTGGSWAVAPAPG